MSEQEVPEYIKEGMASEEVLSVVVTAIQVEVPETLEAVEE
jgi:hypothetical protein